MLKHLPVMTAAALGFAFSLVIVASLSISHKAVMDAQAIVSEAGQYGVSK